MSKTIMAYWEKLSFMRKFFISCVAIFALLIAVNTVLDMRPIKLENLYPDGELARSAFLKAIPLGSTYSEVSQVLKRSNVDFFEYGKISEINPRNLANYKTKSQRAQNIAIHGTDWSDYFNGKYRVWSKVITEYDKNEQLLHVEIFFGALDLEWAI